MEIKTKYNIGQTVGFKVNEETCVAEITDIEINLHKDSACVCYTVNYPDISYDDYGNCFPVAHRVSEENIIGIAEIKFV